MQISVYLFLWIACFTPLHAQRQQPARIRYQCLSYENIMGYCVPFNWCPHVIQILTSANSSVVYKRAADFRQGCGSHPINDKPLVCCTNAIIEPTTAAPITAAADMQSTARGTWRKPETNRNAFVMEKTRTTARPVVTSGERCIGECIDLTQCSVLFNELQRNQNDEEFKSYLRNANRICGSIGQTVCCPMSAQLEQPTSVVVNTHEIPRRVPTVEDGCGITTKVSYRKVVGGVESKSGAFPWIALLGYDRELESNPFKCGGTLITARHVVTAAHCLRRDLSFVRLGEHDLRRTDEAQHVDIDIVKTVAHPDFKSFDSHSDIAVLYLKENAKLSDFIAPICLPNKPPIRTKNYERHVPFVAGWGQLLEGGQTATVLQQLQIPVLNNNACKEAYRQKRLLKSERQFNSAVICAGYLNGGMDTCQGDSGGPLMSPENVNRQTRFFLIGVISYGFGCARQNTPSVYTSVQHFIDWIEEKVADTP